ncbi:MAG TPA: NAD-dependent epimerase/dehydratase family protein [Polyangiaceae bacterium]|nr:NAD-dependent epimerase/dehydratase family protein [Polyangiaceae bacterium]
MHIVVTGATGRIGSALMQTLAGDPRVRSVTGIARRVGSRSGSKTYYVSADVAEEPLAPLFEGADVVVHLAWRFHPEKRPDELWSTNVLGSRRVFDAVRQAGVPRLVYASSFAAYAPRDGSAAVDEASPTTGSSTSLHARHKAEVERRLDEFEARYEGFGIARLRPVATLSPVAASQIVERLTGSLPASAIDEAVVRLAAQLARTPLQIAHARDVAEAFRLAATDDVRGAFNIVPRASHAPDDTAIGASGVMSKAASLALRLRLSRRDQNLVELAERAPLLDGTRAERVLGYSPEYTTEEVLAEALCGLRRASDRPPRGLWTKRPAAQLPNSAHVSVQ